MFTWICPVCGAEVPPSEPECPRCAERRRAAMAQEQPAAATPAPPPPQAQPAAAPSYAPPPQYAPPPHAVPPQYAPPPQYAAPPQPAAQPVYVIGEKTPARGIPAWLAAVLTVAVLGGGLFALYRYVSSSGTQQGAAQKAAPFERPAGQASVHPFAKYIEVTGIRLFEKQDKTLAARFVVINHAPAELSGFRLRVTLEASNAAPGEAVIAVVDAAPGALPPHGIKDVEAPLTTHLKVYELPDWQFIRARPEIIDAK
ncbi:MAG: hypothetical protein N2036_13575 [Bryobacteraceae bacterium]|nr:hypothetical protein [Bryobacteraceae bacterium]